jgi:hypothetical protein
MDQPYGVREYDALDREGQEWYFCQLLDAAKIAPQAKRKAAAKGKPRKAAAKTRRPAKRNPTRKKARRRS